MAPRSPKTAQSPLPTDGRCRVRVEGVSPIVDHGRFPAKRVIGDHLRVEADVFADGRDQVTALVLYRRVGSKFWQEVPMKPMGNDRWWASFELEELGRYEYTVMGWVDPYLTWEFELGKWVKAGSDVSVELEEGALLLDAAIERAKDVDARELAAWAKRLRAWAKDSDLSRNPGPLLDDSGPLGGALRDIMVRVPDRRFASRYAQVLSVVVDREVALFGAWYEFFPRSTSSEEGRHGTFDDARRMLPYVRRLGFDIVYLPPIHPVGRTNRKGPNNRTTSEPGDFGSPWAIGAEEGGHTAVHPELGTLEDFQAFRKAAEEEGLEVALDIAYQCAPDHPWVQDHPTWFRQRPDGSIRYAENPPKKYEDIYPIDFDSEDWENLWVALRDVFIFWMDQGVRIFRVDNPHTKALPFWEWAIGQLKAKDPGVILLSEAFTRPKMMYHLAKLGFTQSYTYFAWRNTKYELMEYMHELVETDVREYFRPNFWPNTPDILTEYLQTGGRSAFMSRLILAAGLVPTYGIYGPAYELLEHTPREPGSEEYLNSEKYQLRSWDLDRSDSLSEYIARVNQIRRENVALHRNHGLRFHGVDNDSILVWSKRDPTGENSVIFVVSLDPHHTQGGWVELDPDALGLEPDESYQVHDILAGGRYAWVGTRNFVQLDPQIPAHIFKVVRPKVENESGGPAGGPELTA